jgi:hypothetical protein
VNRRRQGSISTGGWIAIVAVLVIAAGLIGLVCSGGEATLTREELIEQADAICTENNAELARITATEEGIDLADTERAAIAVERLSVPGLDTTRRMAELVPDPDVARSYDEYLRLRRQRDELQVQVVTALKAGDSEAAGNAQTQALRLYNGPIRDRAQLIGFEVCGKPLRQE